MKRCSLKVFRLLLSRAMKASAVGFAIVMLARIAEASGPGSVTNIFRPLSTPAEYVHELSLLVLGIYAVIFLLVGGLLAYTVIRFRRRQNDDGGDPPQIYGINQIKLAWTVLPISIVFVLSEHLRATADAPRGVMVSRESIAKGVGESNQALWGRWLKTDSR